MGSKAQFVNVYPFIWNDFAKNGYATAWGEDMANVGTFTYRLKGFQVGFQSIEPSTNATARLKSTTYQVNKQLNNMDGWGYTLYLHG